MSDRIDWRPIAIWGTFAGIPLGTAILDGCRRWSARRRPTSCDMILRGETVNGWRTAIAGRAYQKTVARGLYYFVWPLWTVDDGDDGPNEMDEQLSLIVHYCGILPDGRQILNVAQHSLVCDVVSMFLQIVVGPRKEYDVIRCCYLNSRTVALIFEDVFWTAHPVRTTPVVLVDIYTKRHRTLLLTRPQLETRALTVWRENATMNSLHALYYTWSHTNALQHEDSRVEMHHVRYDIPANDAEINETGIQLRSWQSISFCAGNTNWGCVHLHHKPPAIVLSRSVLGEVPDPASVRVLVFDRSLGTWRMVTPDQWLDLILEENENSALIRAAEAISPLSPRTRRYRCRCNPPISNLLKDLHQSVDSTGSVYYAGDSAILQFSAKTASLKRLAAESLCAGNHMFNLAQLKNAIGFDIFDEMATRLTNQTGL